MRWRPLKELVATISIRSSVLMVNAIALFIFIVLMIKAKAIFSTGSLFHLLFSSSWHPFRGEFGLFPFIVGTLEVTALAMFLSVPVCLLSAIYLSEYAPRHFHERVRFGIDILAGIPSVVYGLWGVIVLVPFIAGVGKALGIQTTGYSLLTGGIVLAIMVSPVIISISTDVLRMAPLEARESSLALGTTRWETVKHVLLRESLHGIAAAIVLGFARAFGETIAVLMVVGNVAKIPKSLFDPAYPLPALIANNYGEVMSVPFYESALLFAALILMLVVGAFSLVSHVTLSKMTGRGVR
jgi:phosphate transport system permease protein